MRGARKGRFHREKGHVGGRLAYMPRCAKKFAQGVKKYLAFAFFLLYNLYVAR